MALALWSGRSTLRADALEFVPAGCLDLSARLSAERAEPSAENKSQRLYNPLHAFQHLPRIRVSPRPTII
jgi:hypothetical protein